MKRLYILMMMLLGSLLTAYAQTSTQNYVRTKRYMDNSSYMENIDYYDGLGRIAQQNSRDITPNGNDLVTLHEYDGFGRESKVWLPTPSSTNGAWVDVTTLKNGAISAYNDDLPYGSFVYEQSPQNRVVKEYKAGEAWNEHPKQIAYDVNMSYSTITPVAKSSLSFLAHSDGCLRCGYIGLSNLYLTEYTDEDGKLSYEFHDKKDRLILSKQMDGNTQYATYYVYNVEGKLAYILPPMAVEGLRGDMGMVGDTLNCLQQYAYIYRYDKRGNLKYKKLPGCEPIYYVYDKGDRLIFTQNGEQRTRGEWSFTFPDAFGRVVLEGTCTASLNYNNNPLTETIVNATRTNATDANKGYTISGISVTNMQIHRVNYYDNYTFIGQNSVPTTLSYSTPDTGYGTRYENHYKGLLTGSIVARWENGGVSGYDYAAYYYDQQGRVVQEKRTNHLGGLETYQHAYDRLGNPLKKKHVHTASGKTTRAEELAYTYDSGARPTKVTHKLNSGSTVTLAEYTYDEFCRMANKKLHGSSNSNNQQGYSYNLHGWMTTLTNPNYNLSLTYNSGSVGFNGNITGMYWVTPSGGHMYSFTYDGLNRMLNANHVSGQYTEKVTGYDKNGNILGLQRYGQTGSTTFGLVDNLTYTYNGNKITRVDDAVTATSYTGGTNFINGANTNNEYTYDQNGNLTKDSNKGIANITYNLLSLPQVVTFSDGSTIRYMYSADGTKLRTTHVINGVTTTTDYCGNVIYENGTAKRLLTDEGYVDLTTNTYYYYLKDHQGNNRVVINSSGTVQETNHYYPFGGLFSTSTNVQPYKYNGKELDTKKGLNLYDYGARHYDAALGRWHVVDPLAEKYGALSPYGYCANNPIRLIDIGGCKIVDSNGNVIYTKTGGWTANAPSDAVRIGESMMNTRVGTTQFNKMVDADYNITLNILPETKIEHKGLNTTYYLGDTEKHFDENDQLVSVDVNIYEGTFNIFFTSAKTPKSDRYRASVKSNNDMIGAVATHESVHATDEKNIKDSYENFKNRENKKYEKKDVESEPNEAEHEYLRELFNMYNSL